MRIVVLGLSLSSSWGNGHATTYRALLRALAARGHDILFLERDVPWYAEHRDLADPDFCALRFYDDLAELEALARADRRGGCGDRRLLRAGRRRGRRASCSASRGGVTAFYDIDTPVTLAKLAAGDHEYLAPELIPGFDLYLSFTGGPTLRAAGARVRRARRRARSTARSIPTAIRRPGAAPRWDLGYLGTYSPDRQPVLERLLIEPARRAPDLRFVVAGPQYPDGHRLARECRAHRASAARRARRISTPACRWTLNVTRADMVAAGYQPERAAVRGGGLRDADHLGPLAGLDDDPASRAARSCWWTARRMCWPRWARAMPSAKRSGMRGRRRVLEAHTAAHRAQMLEGLLREAGRRPVAALA